MRPALWILLALLVGGGAVAVASIGFGEVRRQRLRLTYLESEVERWRARSRTLEGELFAALQQSERVRELLADHAETEAATPAPKARRVMTPAVRSVLIALNDCLRADGHGAFRFLFANGLANEELLGVEAIDRNPRTLRTISLVAERVRVRLDRAGGAVVMTFFDGVALRDGKREPLPEDGFPMKFLAVEGPMWERRVGHLLELVGDYPADPNDRRARPSLDKITAGIWRDRLSGLLEAAHGANPQNGGLTYRVATLRDLRDGEFHDVLIHGLADGKRLARSIEAERVAIEFDPKTGVVELVARGGFLHEAAGRSSIADAGYRMFLPGVEPDRARQLMFGMIRPAQ